MWLCRILLNKKLAWTKFHGQALSHTVYPLYMNAGESFCSHVPTREIRENIQPQKLRLYGTHSAIEFQKFMWKSARLTDVESQSLTMLKMKHCPSALMQTSTFYRETDQ